MTVYLYDCVFVHHNYAHKLNLYTNLTQTLCVHNYGAQIHSHSVQLEFFPFVYTYDYVPIACRNSGRLAHELDYTGIRVPLCTVWPCIYYMHKYLFVYIIMGYKYTVIVYESNSFVYTTTMGWLQLVGSFRLLVSFAEYSLFDRVLLQKRPIILRSLLSEATPYELITCRSIHVCRYGQATVCRID